MKGNLFKVPNVYILIILIILLMNSLWLFFLSNLTICSVFYTNSFFFLYLFFYLFFLRVFFFHNLSFRLFWTSPFIQKPHTLGTDMNLTFVLRYGIIHIHKRKLNHKKIVYTLFEKCWKRMSSDIWSEPLDRWRHGCL